MKRIHSFLLRTIVFFIAAIVATIFAIKLFPALPAIPMGASSAAWAAGLSVQPTTPLSLASPLTGAGSAFTYQGRLKTGDVPANGQYDLAFTMYDAPSGGSQVSTPVTDTNQTVSDGLFTANLDFGMLAFDGSARFLEIAVRPSGQGTYATLSPRQPLTPAPYALFALKTQGLKNVMVVAQSGGQFTSIQAALDSITDNSPTNRYLVKIAPGTYTETVAMKPYVDIEGSGEATTKITFSGSGLLNTGTVVGASNAELRSLSVENTGYNYYAIAIYIAGASPSLLDVTATASGQTNTTYGIYNHNASPIMTNVTATASGGNSHNYGVYNTNSSSPRMTNVTATATGGTSYDYGVFNYSNSSPMMTGVTATATGGTSFGVYNSISSSPMMTNVTVTVSGGGNSYGVYNDVSLPRITNSNISASGGGSNVGVYSNSGPVLIDNSIITASTETIGGMGPTRVGSSKLDGGPAFGATCAGVHDGYYNFYANTCP